jgi:hypothetical protein
MAASRSNSMFIMSPTDMEPGQSQREGQYPYQDGGHQRRASAAMTLPPGMGYADEGSETLRQQRSVSQPAPLLDQCAYDPLNFFLSLNQPPPPYVSALVADIRRF